MIILRNGLQGLSIVAVLSLGAFSTSSASDEPKTVSEPAKAATESKTVDAASEDHIMMDHSKADTKSMNMMKDKKIPIHHEGDPPAKSDGSTDCKDHIMMDHSKGDPKSMNLMKDKTVPIHNPCTPTAKAPGSVKSEDHMMMDHSPADTKSMSKMKDKTVPIHHSGADDTSATEGHKSN